MHHLWDDLFAALDSTIGYLNKTSSTIKQVRQSYDDATNEHVILLEYRFKAVAELDYEYKTTMPLLAEVNSRLP